MESIPSPDPTPGRASAVASAQSAIQSDAIVYTCAARRSSVETGALTYVLQQSIISRDVATISPR